MKEKPFPRREDPNARREQMEEALFQMLKTTPYQQITVSKLCACVGIARKVFYRHYRDKEDCLKALIENVLGKSLVYTIQNIPEWGLSQESARVILEYWKENRCFLDIIARDHLLESFVAQAQVLSLEEKDTIWQLLSRPETPCDMDILGCYLGCHFTLVFQWHGRGFDTPVEEMARKYIRLVRCPLFYPGEE